MIYCAHAQYYWQPTEGDDFFDRPKVLAKLHRELDNLANILLVHHDELAKLRL
jgi:hypothetical protein